MLHLRLIQNESELTEILPAWRQLATTPFQQPEWLLSWWQQFKTPRLELLVLAITEPCGDLVGLAPCYLARHRWSRSIIHFLGDGRACTDFQSVLTPPDRQPEVAEFIAEWLLDARQELNWNALEFDGVAAGDTTMDLFAEHCSRRGCTVQLESQDHTWRLDLTGGWDGFLSRLSKNQRSQCRNYANRFDKNSSWTFETASCKTAVRTALEGCMTLHRKRWQASGEDGCFNDPRFRHFVQHACDALLDTQQVHLTLLKQEETPIAALLMFTDAQGNAFVYQTGRDPDLEKMRIGTIHNLIAIRAACDRGTGFIDYMRGDEEYKSRLSAQPTACNQLRVIAPEALAHLQDAIHVAGRTALNALNSRVRGWSFGPTKP